MNGRARFLMKGVVVGLILVGAGILAYCGIVHYVKLKYAEFTEVVPGILYRCGRLKPEIVEEGVRKYGVKTLVDLRYEETAPRGAQTEPEWAARLGLRYFNFRTKVASGEEMVANFLAVVTTPACQPVLVHCHHGRTRTNVCIAMYRITHQGWSVDRAYQEMLDFGLFPSERAHYLHFIQTHEKFDWKKYVTVDPNKPGPVEQLRIR